MPQINEIATPRTVPIIVGGVYQMIPSMGGQYVTLLASDKKYVYVGGYGNHITDMKLRKRRWPEVVTGLVGYTGYGPTLTLTTGGKLLLMTGGKINLFA